MTAPDLSKAAGRHVERSGSKARHEDRVLSLLSQLGGKTCDELCQIYEAAEPGFPWHSTVSARLNGLEAKGLVTRTDEARKTRRGRKAAVYALTEDGKAYVRDLLLP